MKRRSSVAGLLFCFAFQAATANAADIRELKFPALNMEAVAAEDAAAALKQGPMRFAIARDVSIVPGKQGEWVELADGTSVWTLRVSTPDAAHLNFGFTRFHLPASAALMIISNDGSKLGPYGESDNAPTGQLWTQVLSGNEATIELVVDSATRMMVDLELTRVGQGYRGFGKESKYCKSGACNMDVACLDNADPWNENRRAVAAITVNGSDTCSGSLVNNSANDRRLLFATATHCGITASNVASMLAYFNYESPTCRTPGSAASGAAPGPKPNTTLAGLTFLAATNSPFSGATPGNTRSDWALVALLPRPEQSTYNLFWAGWDRRPPPTTCSIPATPASTAGQCATIHHPGVDEKRITFVQEPMTLDNISSAVGVHWRANWDPNPPILANIPAPQPPTLPPNVTEPGSSGSALYDANRRLVGVLSGGPSACGATGASLRDQYGGLFHAWEGVGTSTTRMRDHLDPGNSGVDFIDGINQCNPPGVPTGITATPNGNNRIDVSWNVVAGAERYRVFRSTGACPGGAYAQIAEVTTLSYNDLTVSGGTTYSYRVAAFDDGEACLSAQGTCSSALATGVCALAPTFAGLTSATNSGAATCGIDLAWGTASGNCGPGSTLRYNVYRSTTAGFTPGAGNRIATCSSSTTLADAGLPFGVRQYYVVRSEDLGSTGPGGACGGVEENNLVQRDAVATGPDTNLFVDNVEAGPGSWVAAGTGAGANWAIVTTQANSPSNSWFVPDPNLASSRTLTMAAALAIPATPPHVLEFFHRYATEANFDGGILEYSLDGSTWSDILAGQGTVPANAARFVSGGYNGVMNSGGAFGARAAWHGAFNAAWIRTQVDLADFAGRSVTFRLRSGSDGSVAGTGWWVDDIRVYFGSSCSSIADGLFANGFEP